MCDIKSCCVILSYQKPSLQLVIKGSNGGSMSRWRVEVEGNKTKKMESEFPEKRKVV